MNLKNRIKELLEKYNNSFTVITITAICNKINILREKFALQKGKHLGNIIILNTPQIFNNGYTFSNSKKQKEFLQSQVENFVEQMNHSVSEENLILMYNNLHNLRINESDAHLLLLSLFMNISGKKGIVGGYYNIGKNKICVYTPEFNEFIKKLFFKDKNIISLEVGYTHELLHMSSTIKKNNKRCSGFNHYYNVPYFNFSIGSAINEGYTDLLNKRIFNYENYGGIYEIFMTISSMVEYIVGQDKMTNLYFKADLKGLVAEISKYNSEREVKEFIVNFDMLHKDPRKIYQIISFLFVTYNNKLHKNVENGEITYLEMKEQYDEFKLKMFEFAKIFRTWIVKNRPKYKDNLDIDVFINSKEIVASSKH